MSTAAIVILVIVVVAVLFAAGWFFGGQARSRRLRQKFGPEYDRHVENAEDRKAAERELAEREKRHSQLELRPLSDSARTRYTEEWALVQERFVDEPGDAVITADGLLHNVMRDRGYPTEGFDQQAADLSVEHAAVVEHYRRGHEIRTRHDRTEATTEDLRQALVHYRTIFHELVGPFDGRHDGDADGPEAREAVDRGPARDTARDAVREPDQADLNR
jgi:hypothetical protein